jgi:hypothetical protein
MLVGSLPSRAWKDLSDPNNFSAIGWFGPKTSPDASWHKKLTQNGNKLHDHYR